MCRHWIERLGSAGALLAAASLACAQSDSAASAAPDWRAVPPPPVNRSVPTWVGGRAPLGCGVRALAGRDGRSRWICAFVVTVEVDLPPASSLSVPMGFGVWGVPFDPAAVPGWAYGSMTGPPAMPPMPR